MSVKILYYETSLTVTVPNEGYPGLSLTVSGKVASEQGTPLNERKVRLILDDSALTEVQTDASGTFQVRFTVSAQAKTGQHKITFIVDPKGVYAGTSQQRTITIVKLASTVEVHAPSFVLLPAEIHVEGTVSSGSSPLNNAEVTLTLASESVVVKSLEDGSFNATINVPLNTVFAGAQELNVTVEPAEPWYMPTQTKTSIFLVSSANVGFASATVISVGAVFYMRFVKSKPKKDEKQLFATPETAGVTVLPESEATAVAISSKPEFRFEGAKGKVLEAYAKASKIVESATGSKLQPQMTLREFLQETQPKLHSATELFIKLTGLAEKALYSPYTPEKADIEKAEDLAVKIGEGLQR
jgi:hypothetical protein